MTVVLWLNCFDSLLKKKKLIIIVLFSIRAIEAFYRYRKMIDCPTTAKNKATWNCYAYSSRLRQSSMGLEEGSGEPVEYFCMENVKDNVRIVCGCWST